MQYVTVHSSATEPLMKYDSVWLTKLHKSKGYRTIGYHAVILPDGSIERGRSPYTEGAHVYGHNQDNYGICLIGGVDAEGNACNNYTEAQMHSLRWLINNLIVKYRIPLRNIKGHRDWYGDTNGDGIVDSRDWKKVCPCFDVQTTLREWMT